MCVTRALVASMTRLRGLVEREGVDRAALGVARPLEAGAVRVDRDRAVPLVVGTWSARERDGPARAAGDDTRR